MWERERSMREELISVIIPTYNRRDKVTYAVKSVLDQTYSNIEVIIIDDASTDNTEAEIKKIKDDRIRYIYLEKNHGAAGARNVGIKEANGTYIAFQDSDDIWEKEKLQMQIDKMAGTDNVGLVYCAMVQFDAKGRLLSLIPEKKLPEKYTSGKIFDFMLTYALISTQTMLVRSDIINKMNGFNENLRALEDYEFALRYAKDNEVGFVEMPLVRQILTKDSVNQNGKNKILAEIYILEEFWEDYKRLNKVIPQFEIMRAEAERYGCLEILQEYVLDHRNFYECEAEWQQIYQICFSEQKLLYCHNRKYEGVQLIIQLCENLKKDIEEQQAEEIIEGIKTFSKQIGLDICDEQELCEYNHQYQKLADKIENKLRGQIYVCSVCKNRVIFDPISDYYRENRMKYGFPYWNREFQLENRERYFCPVCGSTDRARLIIEFLSYIKSENNQKIKVLQIAPDSVIERYLRAREDVIYESTDLYMDNVTFKADIQKMDMVDSNYYDLVICAHVLEHVKDDISAMKELYRILKAEGLCIVLVPLIVGLENTDEQWGCSEEENWHRFGQGDHCRLYARDDFMKRLEAVGFQVNELGGKWFGADLYKKCGFDRNSILYVLSKQEMLN